MTNITPQLAIWIQQLRAIAQTGLAFEPRIYDQERYAALLNLAAAMAATVNGDAALDAALAEEFAACWRAQIKPGIAGYVTPKVGVGAVVFNARDEILLVQRAEGPWFIPTGWGDVGLSPAHVAAKEVREETGFLVTPQRVLGVYDGARWGAALNPHFYSIVFYCSFDGGELKRHPAETLDAGFFARDALPQPIWRNRTSWLDHAWAFHRGETNKTYFDQ
ncbi:MAG: NUDIX hydrolase N-terminal domain-containing protein [Chloroflexi bacterium]|nr:NUDIX hydrolase N-terminal domain-containing protein [Chloroflexota bacterium]